MVHMDVMDLISCASTSNPQLRESLEVVLSPFVERVLMNAAGEEPHLVGAVVDLYGVIVKRAAIPLGGHVWRCAQPLLTVVLTSSDCPVLQNACDPICSLVRRAPSQVAEAGLLPQILHALERLLTGELEESACVFVGPVVSLLIAHYGQQLPVDITAGLLRATVSRLAKS